MASPNQLDPTFNKVDAWHGKGISVTAVNSNNTTAVNVFGATNGFTGTITGVYLVSLDTTNANMTLRNDSSSVCVIATGTTSGALVGGTTLSNTTISASGTMVIVMSANSGARVFITYKSA